MYTILNFEVELLTNYIYIYIDIFAKSYGYNVKCPLIFSVGDLYGFD